MLQSDARYIEKYKINPQYLLRTDLRWQVHFHRDVRWPVAHSEDIHCQLDIAGNVLALHILQKYKDMSLSTHKEVLILVN